MNYFYLWVVELIGVRVCWLVVYGGCWKIVVSRSFEFVWNIGEILILLFILFFEMLRELEFILFFFVGLWILVGII